MCRSLVWLTCAAVLISAPAGSLSTAGAVPVIEQDALGLAAGRAVYWKGILGFCCLNVTLHTSDSGSAAQVHVKCLTVNDDLELVCLKRCGSEGLQEG